MADIDDNDDESEQVDTSQPQSAISNTALNPNNIDPSQLFAQAKQNLSQAQSTGITPEQLNALAQHQGNNSLINMFMQLVGAAGRVNPKPYQDLNTANTNQEAQRLALQNQLSQQNLSRAQASEQLGTTALGAQQKQMQLRAATAPISNLQQANIIALAQKSGQTIDPETLKNMTQIDYNNALPGLEKTGTLSIQQQHNTAITDLAEGKATYKDIGTGLMKYKFTGEVVPGQENNSGTTNTNTSNEIKANDLIGAIDPASKNAYKGIVALQNTYKPYMKDDNAYQNTNVTTSTFIDDALKGNQPVAASELKFRIAKALGGLQQRLTDYDVKQQTAGLGLINQGEAALSQLGGSGPVSSDVLKQYQDLMNKVQSIHGQGLADVQNRLRTQANAYMPKGKVLDDDAFLFGTSPSTSTKSSTSQSVIPDNHINFDDYLKSRQ